jgi:hypothetical protein
MGPALETRRYPLHRLALGLRRSIAAVGLLLVAAGALSAQPTPLVSLPFAVPTKTQQQMATHGLLLSVESLGESGLGYRPLRLTFTQLTPPTADRSLTVEYATYRRWRMNMATRSTATFELLADGWTAVPAAAGTPAKWTATAELRAPQYEPSDTYGIRVWEDGALLEELSVERMSTGGQQYSETLPRILAISPKPNVTTGLAAALTTLQQQSPAVGAGGAAVQLPGFRELAAADLPTHWLDYTTYDLVVVSMTELEALVRSRPECWQALRRWIAAGGNLVVYEPSGDWRWLEEFERIAQPPRTLAAQGSVVAGSGAEGATNADSAASPAVQFPPHLVRQGVFYALPTAPGWQATTTSSEQEQQAEWHRQPSSTAMAVPPADLWPPVDRVIRPWDLGQVLALRSDPFSTQADAWTQLLAELGDERTAAAPRLGLSAINGNPDFWNWLVPNVGLPPVDAFRVLITLFVIAIGPVNYFVLRRLGRLHLLVFIVPGCALLVTLALLAYAVLADGLGVKLRPRTLTVLDQPRGEGVCWSRLSYYAGMAPSGGLAFSPDTAVYPLVSRPDPLGRGMPQRNIVWGENQNLTRGWLASRTPTQLVTVRACATAAALEVSPSAGGLTVKNLLDARVSHVLLADDQGGFYYAEDVPPGQTATAASLPLADGLARLAPILGRSRPAAPPEIALFQASEQGYRSWSTGWDTGWPDPSQGTSRLELAFEQLSNSASAGRLPLGPRSYAALVERSPLAEYGYEPVEEAGGIHLILGRW